MGCATPMAGSRCGCATSWCPPTRYARVVATDHPHVVAAAGSASEATPRCGEARKSLLKDPRRLRRHVFLWGVSINAPEVVQDLQEFPILRPLELAVSLAEFHKGFVGGGPIARVIGSDSASQASSCDLLPLRHRQPHEDSGRCPALEVPHFHSPAGLQRHCGSPVRDPYAAGSAVAIEAQALAEFSGETARIRRVRPGLIRFAAQCMPQVGQMLAAHQLKSSEDLALPSPRPPAHAPNLSVAIWLCTAIRCREDCS